MCINRWTLCCTADRHFSHAVSRTGPQVHHHPDQSSVFTDLGQEDWQIDFGLFGSKLWWPNYLSALQTFPARTEEQTTQPTGSWGVGESLRNVHSTVQAGSNCEVAEWIYWCYKQHACNSHSSLMMILPWEATVVVTQRNISILQPSVFSQLSCYSWYMHAYRFAEDPVHTGTGMNWSSHR